MFLLWYLFNQFQIGIKLLNGGIALVIWVNFYTCLINVFFIMIWKQKKLQALLSINHRPLYVIVCNIFLVVTHSDSKLFNFNVKLKDKQQQQQVRPCYPFLTLNI